MSSIYSTSTIPSGIQIYPSAVDFPAVGTDGQQLVAADTNTIYIYQSNAPAGWKPVANPGAAIAIDALTGEVTATGPGVVAATITNAAVTNAKLAAMADNTVKGNKSGAPASPSDLALSDVTETTSSVLTITNGSKAIVSPANLTIQVKQSSSTQDGYLSSVDWSTFNNAATEVSNATALATPNTIAKRDASADCAFNVLKIGAGTALAPSLAYSADLDTGLFFAGNNIVNLATNGLERMRVDANGNVGIGSQSPNARLQVNQSGTQLGLSVYSTSSNNTAELYNQGTTNYTLALNSAANSAQTGASIGGYFARGTLSSRAQTLANDSLLSVTASGYTGTGVAGISAGIVLAADQNTGASAFGGQIVFATTPNNTVSLPLPRMVIKNNGQVGINTLTPLADLDVNGPARSLNFRVGDLGTAGSPSYTFATDSDTGIFSSGTNSISLTTNGNERIRVTAIGELRVFNLTASQLVATDASKNLQSLDTATYPSLTEISYVKGVTSSIQTQLNGKVSSVSGSAPISSSGGTTPTISISQAGAASDGYLSSTDWNTFNNKQPAGSYVTSVGATAPVTSTGGTTPTIAMPVATALVDGYLSSADWSTFNGKQPAGNYITALTGEVTATGPGSVAATIAANAVTNAKLAQMATLTIKGNNTGGPSDPLDLSVSDTTAMLNVMVGDSGAGGLKGLVPAPVTGDATKYLRGDATWATINLSGYANTTLSNLTSPTSINQSLLFSVETFDIGASAANRPNNLYVKTTATVNTIKIHQGTGNASTPSFNANIGIGAGSLNNTGANTHGNVAIGYEAFANANGSSPGGSGGVAIGSQAGRSVTSAIASIFIGASSGYGATNGHYNCGVGAQSLYSVASGQYNTALGVLSGYSATGSSNVFLGAYAGYRNTTSSNELFIDNQDRTSYNLQQSNSLIYGTFNSTVGSQRLRINGQVNLTQGEKHASVHGQVGTANVITATINNYYIGVDSSLAAKTVNLPAASGNQGLVLTIKDEGGLAATNNILIDAAGGELIDGALTQTIAANWGSLSLMCSGSAWFII